jgi:signal transduction histidine kinase
VAVDADRLQQVTLNLLTNAVRATEPGGWVRVALRAVASPASALPSNAVQLTVSDSGCGIAPEVQPRLFEPFFTTAARDGGAGLGLAVVRAIVLEHGGQVAVSSAPGQGSTFTVTLPLHGGAL